MLPNESAVVVYFDRLSKISLKPYIIACCSFLS